MPIPETTKTATAVADGGPVAVADLLDPVRNALEPLRGAYEGLNPRERRYVQVLGALTAVLVIVLPIYLLTSAIAELEQENDEIADVLRDVARSRDLLAARKAAREAAAARYDRRAPPLGSFVEEKARKVDLGIGEVTDQPELALGKFTRREVRVSLPPNSELGPVLQLLADIENSEYPVAVERLRIEHFQEGANRFNVQFAVAAYDRAQPAREERSAGAADGRRERRRRVGPPGP